MSWWGSGNTATALLVKEVTAMKAVFDKESLKPVLKEVGRDNEVAYYIETLKRELELGRGNSYWKLSFRLHDTKEDYVRGKGALSRPYKIKILYRNHPYQEPYVYVLSHRINHSTPHVLRDDDDGYVLCLWDHSSRTNRGWDPAKSTAATMALWATQWLRAWKHWEETNYWPIDT